MVTPGRLIAPLLLPNTGTLLLTAPVGRRVIVKKVICANIDPGPTSQGLAFYRVPSGGSYSATTDVVVTTWVAPNRSLEIYELEGATLEPGDMLYGYCTTSASTVWLHLDGTYVDLA
jgi:hypothetical protein